MQVKIDTKERFHVITIQEPVLSANMTDGMYSALLTYLQKAIKNIVLNLKDTISIDDAAAEALNNIQQSFYDNNASFVICNLNQQVEQVIENCGLLELMNVVPTESEAGDLIQMEEIEREFMEDE